jgi:hypothetical protein
VNKDNSQLDFQQFPVNDRKVPSGEQLHNDRKAVSVTSSPYQAIFSGNARFELPTERAS